MTERSARWAAVPLFVVVALVLLAFNLRAPFVAVSAVSGDLEDALGMSPAAVGLLTSLPVLCFGLGTPLASAVIGRIGVERSVFVCLGALLVGIAVRSAGGIGTAIAGTLVIGLAITVGNIVAPMIIARDFPRSAAAGVTGVYTAALNVGSMVALTVTAPVATAAGWALALALPSVLAVLAAAVWVVLVRRRRPPPAAHREVAASAAHRPPGASLGQLFRRPATWMLTGAFVGQAFGYYGLTAWLPTLLADERGLAENTAGLASSIFQVSAVGGAFLTPVIINRFGPVAAFAVNGALWLTMPLGLLLAPGGWALWSVCSGVAQGGGFVAVFTVVVLRTRSQRENRQLSSIVQTGGYAVASLGPVVVGGLHASTDGWTAPLLVVTGSLLMLTGLGMLAARTPRRAV